MTRKQAIRKALQLAKKTGRDFYVFDESEPGFPRFLVGDDDDAETFFLGSEPIFSTADF